MTGEASVGGVKSDTIRGRLRCLRYISPDYRAVTFTSASLESMSLLGWAAVLLVTLVSVVRPQCISDNDQLVLTSKPDLGHITPFSLDLFKQLYPPTATGSFFFSPYSIWTALVLAYFGSAGRTRQQLQDTLRLRDPSNTLATYKALDRLTSERRTNTSEYVIDLANKVYVDNGISLRDCVRDVLQNEVQNVDFQKAAEAAAIINQFVEKVTRGKITNIVTTNDVRNIAMALVNAAYFKGLWLAQFQTNATIKAKFYHAPGQHTLVDMMNQVNDFRVGDSSELGATVLEMPYKGKAASMFVLLPHNKPGDAPPNTDATTPLDAMLRRLSHNTLRHALNNLKKEKVNVQFPKFKLEHTITDELKLTLENMGIKDLFSPSSDLSNYVEGGNLSVEKVIHKAVVEVNEEGSEAAAATVLLIDRIMIRVFHCDRPFVFFIHDNHTHNILFLGVFRKP